ncbi:hypothetical protein Pla123a_48350 [Posidoniimonas polymericola]|uniref:Uncharacterized protein n=1 Tax=Posidoniimonas polymericola TaxID=2528002 RepID=A0A5C5XSM8_9BACT|nr:hypothetical protein Pla123a_48350 [Posidoniimonas polymericola]
MLAKVAFLAAIGWGLTYALEPQVSQSWLSHWQRTAASPFAGYGWFVACGAVSSLLAMVGAAFVRQDELGRV